MTTPTISFTPEGGRFGRIQWSNGDDDFWGCVDWDIYWPDRPPAPPTSLLADALAACSALAMALKAFGDALARNTELRDSITRLYQMTTPTAHDQ